MNNGTKFCMCRRRSVAIDQCQGCESDADSACPTCKGSGTVNPLTAPTGFFCVGTTDCPHCDGTGESA